MGDALLKNRFGFARTLCALSVLTNTVACSGSHVSDAQPMQGPTAKSTSPSALNSASPSAAPSGGSVASVAAPSKLLSPPTLAQAGGKCVCGVPKQIGTSAYSARLTILPDVEPYVDIAGTRDGMLAAWWDTDDSMRVRPLDAEGNPTAPPSTLHDSAGIYLLPLADGNFVMIGTHQAWTFAPDGHPLETSDTAAEPAGLRITQTPMGLFFRSEEYPRTWLTRLSAAGGHIDTMIAPLVTLDTRDREYLPPAVDAAGLWYLFSSGAKTLRLESDRHPPQEFESPQGGTPEYLAVDEQGRLFLYVSYREKGRRDLIFELVEGTKAPQPTQASSDLFADHAFDVHVNNKWMGAGHGPLEFYRHVLGGHETAAELTQCTIGTRGVGPYVHAGVIWSGNGFVAIYEEGDPKNYRIFVSRVTCDG